MTYYLWFGIFNTTKQDKSFTRFYYKALFLTHSSDKNQTSHNFYLHPNIVQYIFHRFILVIVNDLSKNVLFLSTTIIIIYFVTVKHFIIMKPNRFSCYTKKWHIFGGSRKRSTILAQLFLLLEKYTIINYIIYLLRSICTKFPWKDSFIT